MRRENMYLLRLDDASEHWKRDNWDRIHMLLSTYGIKPIVAIIPNNQDPSMLRIPEDPEFLPTIQEWINEGWIPALHGCNHLFYPSSGGLNPVNRKSEFADRPLNEQMNKIDSGYRLLINKGIHPLLFVAPGHTFDENTVLALQYKTPIRIISDTIANDIYYQNGFYYIPQQSGQVRKIFAKLVTFCYHPDRMTERQFDELESFLKQNSNQFVSFSELELKKRRKTLYDRLLSFVYFFRREIVLHLNTFNLFQDGST